MTAHQQQLVAAILADLALLDGGLKAEALLYAGVRGVVNPSPTYSDFTAALRWCESHHWVDGILGDYDVTKWGITDLGLLKHRR
jgi:hypothetical protein